MRILDEAPGSFAELPGEGLHQLLLQTGPVVRLTGGLRYGQPQLPLPGLGRCEGPKRWPPGPPRPWTGGSRRLARHRPSRHRDGADSPGELRRERASSSDRRSRLRLPGPARAFGASSAGCGGMRSPAWQSSTTRSAGNQPARAGPIPVRASPDRVPPREARASRGPGRWQRGFRTPPSTCTQKCVRDRKTAPAPGPDRGFPGFGPVRRR